MMENLTDEEKAGDNRYVSLQKETESTMDGAHKKNEYKKDTLNQNQKEAVEISWTHNEKPIGNKLIGDLKLNSHIQTIAKDVGKMVRFLCRSRKYLLCFIITKARLDQSWNIATISALDRIKVFTLFYGQRMNW